MEKIDKLIELMEAQLEETRALRKVLEPKKSEKVDAKRECIPYKDIFDAYNGICTGLKRCEVINDKRKRMIQKLWLKYLPDLERWQTYFELCNQDVWFNGVRHHGNLDTICQEEKVVRMFEQGPRNE